MSFFFLDNPFFSHRSVKERGITIREQEDLDLDFGSRVSVSTDDVSDSQAS